MRKILSLTIFAMIFAIASTTAFAGQQQQEKMIMLRQYADEHNFKVYYEQTGSFHQVFVFPHNDVSDIWQFVNGSTNAYHNAKPFKMPAPAVIKDGRMNIPETVANML
ncbi:hypothetical protein SAMN05660649_00295 [Desulfotomaculum arcticum]|uniref:Uncharacterized protein n=1 Tax=Desulfotruncus arcticus DSM 17038 TaxID=1121424 RepID=A0A1I2N3F4_9FIRM|nr:hypothetical protein [Desulfotruncus arcticus]SFF97640.1 hypothetical protein SAMN05660649_00295 [Desulfotomaculum arcticum] [Desulfotruncus arcticus DSM 17038]